MNNSLVLTSDKPQFHFQTGNKRGSFLSRDSSTLEKLAEMTKSASAPKAGSGAKNSKNFIFAVLSPPKGSKDDESSSLPMDETREKRKKSSAGVKKSLSEPLKKKARLDRAIDENSSDTIFGNF